ncbi:hypothetical protein NK8_72410 (plasmid) [Caballeronia sp. NK8]|nr:hypothetical protein NK8_72410 [Caballeronia sp. NK8]
MNVAKLRVFVSAAALAGESAPYADMPRPDWMSKEQAIQKPLGGPGTTETGPSASKSKQARGALRT